MTGLIESKLHHFGSPNLSSFDSCVVCTVCPRILASWSEEILDTRDIRTWEEGEVIDPEKGADPPQGGGGGRSDSGPPAPPGARRDVFTAVTLRGASLARAVFRREARDCAR